MDQQLILLSQQLQAKLDALDPRADQEALLWAHGFLREMIGRIEGASPELKSKILRQDIDNAARILKEMTSRMGVANERDSLERIEEELRGEEPPEAGTVVGARRKPGPKGLSGGVALPLPDTDLKV